MTDTTHNGWTTYETWLVNLWITNEEPSQRYWTVAAEAAREDAPEQQQVTRGIWTAEEAAVELLENRLKAEVTDGVLDALGESSGLACDLLNSALDDVDWREVAENLLSGLEDTV